MWSCDQATWILSMGWLLGCLSAPAKASMDPACFDKQEGVRFRAARARLSFAWL